MRARFALKLNGGATLLLGPRTLVVGVLNVTPDSFSDGGRNIDPDRAAEHALRMESEGADIIEIGGESTRPGARSVPAEEELARVLPVIQRLAGKLAVPISLDTYKSEVARAGLEHGVAIINDVSALRFDPPIAEIAARYSAALVLMHMRGKPGTMQQIEPSNEIFSEIEADLSAAVSKARSAGVGLDRIVIDPGIGFGKTLEQNLEIINRLDRLAAMGFPLMIGASRKSFIGKLTGRPPGERLFGTAASVAAAIIRGAHFIRVHDVKEMVEVARITDAIISEQGRLYTAGRIA
jgi:dihydropteroate synthase